MNRSRHRAVPLVFPFLGQKLGRNAANDGTNHATCRVGSRVLTGFLSSLSVNLAAAMGRA
jgi:hypothetical protein